MVLYKNVWPKDSNFPERLESAIEESDHEYYSWKTATVGDSEVMESYRKCVDFKMRQSDVAGCPSEFEEANKVYQEVIAGVRECLKHYVSLFNLELEFEEATNFVRYHEGEHFALHPDNGFSYSATTSTIAYLNDGYEGGELLIPLQDIKFTPQKNDVLIMPSNYPFVHASLPIIEGVKYSAVTMYDYNDRNHQYGPDSQVPYAAPATTAASSQIASAS